MLDILLSVIIILLVVIIIVLINREWKIRVYCKQSNDREYKNMGHCENCENCEGEGIGRMFGPEGEFGMEVGSDEFWKAMMANLANNMKRTYDEYQGISLEQVRDLHAHTMKIMSDAQAHTVTSRGLEIQATQNAIETANMIGKRALGLYDRQDVTFNKFTNLDAEEAAGVNQVLSAVEIAAIKAIVVEAVASLKK